MKTLCKKKKKSSRCKKANLIKYQEIATHQCLKCERLACCKKALCKPQKVDKVECV